MNALTPEETAYLVWQKLTGDRSRGMLTIQKDNTSFDTQWSMCYGIGPNYKLLKLESVIKNFRHHCTTANVPYSNAVDNGKHVGYVINLHDFETLKRYFDEKGLEL